MPDLWYFADRNERVGPLTLQELLDTLATLPNASDSLVWCDKFSDWKRAGDVAEFRARIAVPPPLPPDPAPPPPQNPFAFGGKVAVDEAPPPPQIPSPLRERWLSIKRGFLFGLTSFLVVGVIGSLVRGGLFEGGLKAGVLPWCNCLLILSAGAVRAARKAPPNKSRVHAVVGWLIGFFVIGVIFGAMWLFT